MMTFPEILIMILGVFIICFLIDRGGLGLVKIIKKIYETKLR